MSSHYLAIHHEAYDRSTVFGVFDTFIAARDHLEAESAKPGATTCERSAVIEQWSGGELIATHERNWLSPQVWEES